MRHGKLEDSDARVAKSFPIRVATIAVALVAAIFFTGCATASKQATAGKFYHVGLVWLKEPGNAEHRQKIIAAAHSFAREIPARTASRSSPRVRAVDPRASTIPAT